MLLAIDVGNSSTKFGVFASGRLFNRFSIPTSQLNSKENAGEKIQAVLPAGIHSVITCSVVPAVTSFLRQYFADSVDNGLDVVDSTFDFNLINKYQPPETLGTDRLVAAFAAVEKYGAPCIVCDFGTATTIDVVNEKREFLGGMISPGMETLAESLHLRTANLPHVQIVKPGSAIGTNTMTAIQSGIFFGYIGLVKELLDRATAEFSARPKVVATGGFGPLIAGHVSAISVVDADLILDGLNLLFQKSRSPRG
jgi:type III pantothenate kinase